MHQHPLHSLLDIAKHPMLMEISPNLHRITSAMLNYEIQALVPCVGLEKSSQREAKSTNFCQL